MVRKEKLRRIVGESELRVGMYVLDKIDQPWERHLLLRKRAYAGKVHASGSPCEWDYGWMVPRGQVCFCRSIPAGALFEILTDEGDEITAANKVPTARGVAAYVKARYGDV